MTNMNLTLTVCQIAEVAHEINRAYCRAIGDPIKPSWNEGTEQQRQSLIKGVMFQLTNPKSSPGDSHAEWLSHKTASGWRYGETYSEIAMTHPDLVSFDRLPIAQQAKDHLFIAVVRQLQGLTADLEANGYVKEGYDPNDALSRNRLHDIHKKMTELVGDTKINPEDPIDGEVDL